MTSSNPPNPTRRQFIKTTTAGAAAGAGLLPLDSANASSYSITFPAVDSLVVPGEWESLNPGYWQIKNGALRRRLTNVGDRARKTGFPFHYMSAGGVMPTKYDPSLPSGMIYRRDLPLSGPYTISATFVFHGERSAPASDDDPSWKMFQDGYGQLGVAFGAKCLFESYQKSRHVLQAVWSDDQKLSLLGPRMPRNRWSVDAQAFALKPGDEVRLQVKVIPSDTTSTIEVAMFAEGHSPVSLTRKVPKTLTDGYFGIVGRGLIDFELKTIDVSAPNSQSNQSADIDCYNCYPLGDTLRQNRAGEWQVRFVSLFGQDGQRAEIRISSEENPKEGWQSINVAGSAPIVNNDFRRNTAVIDVTLPQNPADTTMFYTVWKDGVNVTSDTRIGTPATGPGTGLVGDVPSSGSYVGRLPRLTAPYKLCGLSCHAITSGLQSKGPDGYRISGGGDVWQFRDQPTEGSYQYLEDYNFQVMVWEDDVWYMELVLYPPSTDDAYKIVKHSICGPTSRWQMMRHWNVINPGDHDYGMDDVKGPEQIVIRRVDGLGQDTAYMQRNFQIVHHLITGAQKVDPLANPKKWRAWKMPNRDFTLVILDSRLWRSSQDTDIWDDSGWEAFKSLYDRTDPTRSLLGEEQFAWLSQLVTNDTSRLMCLTGINGMHTIWTGGKREHESRDAHRNFSQRDRVAADYAGWVKAGCDRVLELLGSREGIVTVYGDVHNGCIMKNVEQGVIECSFGPIGRSGGRGVIPGFGRRMTDVDGRDVEIHALYHKTHADPELMPHQPGDPFYWNFLEMEFDPTKRMPTIGLRVRNMIDSPHDEPRGGGVLETTSSETGRMPTSKFPEIRTLANADVRISTVNGEPIRATRSYGDGSIVINGLVDVGPGEQVIMIAYDGSETESRVVTTL